MGHKKSGACNVIDETFGEFLVYGVMPYVYFLAGMLIGRMFTRRGQRGGRNG